jgi:hypothetical protein
MSNGPGPDEDGQRCKRLGLWKVAVIAEGVMRRAIDEPHDVSATASHSQRVASALCACDSCDERDLAVESAHRRFLVSRR